MKFLLLLVLICGMPFAAASKELCENWSAADWDHFIQTEIVDHLFSGAKQLSETISNIPKKCLVHLRETSPCFDRIENYFRQITPDDPHKVFSGRMTNKEYLTRLRKAPAEANTLPPELMLATRGLPDHWQEIAKQKGWKWAFFHSSTNVGKERRLVFYIPGKKYDRLLLFFSTKGDPPKKEDFINVQMQAIEKTSPKDPAKIYFSI